jgi:hypothetical protein
MSAYNELDSRMLINQITPIYPRIMKKSTHMPSVSRRCWTQQLWWTRFTTETAESGVTSLITDRVPMGTRPVASLHRRCMAEGMIGMTVTCVTSSMIEMHAFGSKTGAKSESACSGNDTMKGTMLIMVPTMTNLTNNAPLKEGII